MGWACMAGWMFRKTTMMGNILRCANSSTQKCKTKRAPETWLEFGGVSLLWEVWNSFRVLFDDNNEAEGGSRVLKLLNPPLENCTHTPTVSELFSQRCKWKSPSSHLTVTAEISQLVLEICWVPGRPQELLEMLEDEESPSSQEINLPPSIHIDVLSLWNTF